MKTNEELAAEAVNEFLHNVVGLHMKVYQAHIDAPDHVTVMGDFRPRLTATILHCLTQAQSGAVEALQDSLCHGTPIPAGPRGESVAYQANPENAMEALANLRSITETDKKT
jgi:hypothetical protein